MQTKQPDITRDKVLDAAFCEIHRSGFQAASIANILASTGLTKGALYHHFPTKQALGLAVVDEIISKRLDAILFRPLRDSDHPVEALLQTMAGMGERASSLTMLGCPLNNLMQEMSPLDNEFKDHLNDVLNAWRTTIEDALQRGKAQGVVRDDVDCHAAALFIVSAWEGCVGIAKNLQSAAALISCMGQLQDYVNSLRVAA
jgi:TetR/AcrR family transcriptional regulator, transcriptional repressor for nem operon